MTSRPILNKILQLKITKERILWNKQNKHFLAYVSLWVNQDTDNSEIILNIHKYISELNGYDMRAPKELDLFH